MSYLKLTGFQLKTVADRVVSEVLRRQKLKTRPHRIPPFKYIAITGYSGALVGAHVSHSLRKRLIIARPACCENAHHGNDVEFEIPGSTLDYLFLDDFISSGKTVRSTVELISDHAREAGVRPKCVGAIFYRDHTMSKSNVARLSTELDIPFYSA